MKKVLFVPACMMICSFSFLTPVFDFSITLPDGNVRPLSVYQGKPIMIVLLPSLQSDTNSAMLSSLDTLQQQFRDSLTFIGIPSYEDGYEDDSIGSIMSWYYSVLDSGFVVAQGMNTRKTSPYQSELFHWLTHAEENGHFDEDVIGVGEKFLITADGTLHALVSPDAALDEQILEDLLRNIE